MRRLEEGAVRDATATALRLSRPPHAASRSTVAIAELAFW
jgi:hypothetical protein